MVKPTRKEYSEQFEYLYNERLGQILEGGDIPESVAQIEARKEAQQLIKEYYPDE